jgi:hypothetical protein
MSSRLMTEDLHRFILTAVPSVPFLEAMLVYRAARGAGLEARDIARRLYLPEHASVDLQAALREAGIIVPVAENATAHRYDPVTAELAALLDRLAAAYAEDLIAVTHVIHSKTGRRAQQLADAFKWKKAP